MTRRPSRRDFLKRVGSGTAALAAPAAIRASRPAAGGKPNIIVFLSDDHGWEYAGCYGNRQVRTPNLDRLAAEGMRFTHVFAGSPTCTPSRSVLYTGLMPMRNGAAGNHSRARPGTKSLPHYLRPLGYRVVLAHKVHVRPREVFPFEHVRASLTRTAFKRRYREEGLDTAAVERLLARHVREHRDQPLCLILAASAPHVYWEANRTYDAAALKLPPYLVDTEATRRGMARYYQDITSMDRRLGRCLAAVRKHGLEDSTLFLYTSDQGPEWPHAKWNLYDAGLRVPFVARWPGRVKPGTVCQAMVSLVDVLPTFVEAGGGKAPGGLDGRSFLPVLLGRAKDHRDAVFAAHVGDGNMNDYPMRCVRTRTHKYILNLKPQNTYTTHFTRAPGADHKDIWDTWVERAGTNADAARLIRTFQHRAGEELFDLRRDPNEMSSVASGPESRPVLLSLRKRVRDWMKSQGDEASPSRANPPPRRVPPGRQGAADNARG